MRTVSQREMRNQGGELLRAVHLAVALRLQADEIVTYDSELVEAAHNFGLLAVAPV